MRATAGFVRMSDHAIQLAENAVPVSMGSPRFDTWHGGAVQVTHAWFAGNSVLPPHVHDRPTFAVILHGGFDLVFTSPAIGRSRLSCRPGSIFTEPAGERHANHVSPEGARVVAVQPDLASHELPASCLRLLDRINHFRDGPIHAAGRRLAREVLSPDDVTPVAADALVFEMLAEAARLDGGTRLDGGSPPSWLLRATECLHDRFRERLRVADLALVAGVHSAHLAAVFRRVHRVSLGSYIRRLRVDWAADRLVSSGDPISVVAAEAGFSDQAHLTRWFSRVFGSTPAAYRKTKRWSHSPTHRADMNQPSS